MFKFQAGLKKIPNGPNQFALVIIGVWNPNEIHPEAMASIKNVYKLIKRKTPAFLEFGPGYEDQLKNWLCKPQNRESDLIAINCTNSMYGIETDIVLHVGSTCKKGCYSMLNPVAMTRAKSMLILSKFEALNCVPCSVRRATSTTSNDKNLLISQPHLTPSGRYVDNEILDAAGITGPPSHHNMPKITVPPTIVATSESWN